MTADRVMQSGPPFLLVRRFLGETIVTLDKEVWSQELLEAPHDVPDKADRVRSMFDAIAPRYELVNRLCSGGQDAAWRRRAVQLARVTSDDDVLDIACGTGNFTRAFLRAGPRSVVGCDFSENMLRHAANRGDEPLSWRRADALDLPFDAGSFSITSCAFGVRNFCDLDRGLREMARVLRSGGRAVILEFSRPTNTIVRFAYEFYANRIMPRAATWISGDQTGAYRYLPRSVVSFLSAGQMRKRLDQAGFARTEATRLSLGVVTVHVAYRD